MRDSIDLTTWRALADRSSELPGSVNPPFTIGQIGGDGITFTQPIVVAAQTQQVPAPHALTLVGAGIAALGLLLRFRALRGRVTGDQQ